MAATRPVGIGGLGPKAGGPEHHGGSRGGGHGGGRPGGGGGGHGLIVAHHCMIAAGVAMVLIGIYTLLCRYYALQRTRSRGKKRGGKLYRLTNRVLSRVRWIAYRQPFVPQGRSNPSLSSPKTLWQRISMPAVLSSGRIIILLLYFLVLFALFFSNLFGYGSRQDSQIAKRSGGVAMAHYPFMVALAGRYNIIGTITGISYERLNWLHRWVARVTLVLSIVHTIYYVKMYNRTGENSRFDWGKTPTGYAALAFFAWTLISSFAPIRNMRYEFFVAQHIISFIAIVVLTAVHVGNYPRFLMYCWWTVALFAFDRLIRAALLLWKNFGRSKSRSSPRAHLEVLPGQTTKVTIVPSAIRSWAPGQHIFLHIPNLGPMQSHPFTISNIADPADDRLELLVQGRNGFSHRLLAAASKGNNDTYQALVEGPYGVMPTWEAYDQVFAIAGSTGVSYTLPILQALAQKPGCVQKIFWVWVVKKSEHIEWCDERLQHIVTTADPKVQIQISIYITRDNPCDRDIAGCNKGFDRCFDELTSSPSSGSMKEEATQEEVDNKNAGVTSSERVLGNHKDAKTTLASIGVIIKKGRPDTASLLDAILEEERQERESTGRTDMGELLVTSCGPLGLIGQIKNLIAERQTHTKAALTLFSEEFGW